MIGILSNSGFFMNAIYYINSLLAVFFWSYLVGSIPNGYLIGKFNGLDIREHGSHNIGATNVRRILGRDWSILCFVLDFLKGWLPVLYIGHHLAANWACGAAIGGLIAAIAAVCGHIFPIWLKFKGGKGVATSLGVVCGLAFIPLIAGVVAWLVVFYSCKHIVSVASMAAVTVMAIVALAMYFAGCPSMPFFTALLIVILAGLVIIRHKDNIIRLIHGNENSFVKVNKKK